MSCCKTPVRKFLCVSIILINIPYTVFPEQHNLLLRILFIVSYLGVECAVIIKHYDYN